MPGNRGETALGMSVPQKDQTEFPPVSGYAFPLVIFAVSTAGIKTSISPLVWIITLKCECSCIPWEVVHSMYKNKILDVFLFSGILCFLVSCLQRDREEPCSWFLPHDPSCREGPSARASGTSHVSAHLPQKLPCSLMPASVFHFPTFWAGNSCCGRHGWSSCWQHCAAQRSPKHPLG